MPDAGKSLLLPRKQPRQARSNELVAAVLEAATRILETEGARRFTTARVAEKAGISVGSLYQYFPNKAAILFQLQREEWERTTQQWNDILGDPGRPPLERLRTLVHVFLRSECDEAAIRGALNDAAPLLRDGPGQGGPAGEEESAIRGLMREALPEAPEALRRLAADLVEATLTEVGEQFSDNKRTEAEIEACADAMADMFEAYLDRLRHIRDVHRGSGPDQVRGA